jgi:hypothetical protein
MRVILHVQTLFIGPLTVIVCNEWHTLQRCRQNGMPYIVTHEYVGAVPAMMIGDPF